MKKNNTLRSSTYKQLLVAFTLSLIFLMPQLASATIKTSVATGNWSAGGTWSGGTIPASGDTVVIHGGNTVTVNGAYTCKNLNVGDATSSNTTLTITTGNSLTITDEIRINPNNLNRTYIMDAGAGTLNINGTIAHWSTTGTNSIRVAAGTLNVTPALTIANANQNVTFTGAGTINFSETFTDSYNRLVTFAACTVNFSKSYVVNTTAASWAGRGTAVFAGTGYSITPTSNLTLFNVQFTGNTTLNSGAGTVIVGGDLTIASGKTFTASKDFNINGNWTNNGGTFSGTGYTVAFNGGTKTIGGTASTTFGTLQFGSAIAAVTQSVTINTSAVCSALIIHGGTNARTVTVALGDTLTVNGNATINQPTAAVTNALSVGAGVCNITGDLTFAGSNNTATYIGRVTVTTGTFTLGGNITWMSNTAVATEVISVTTGSLIFGSSVTMGSGSGTITATGAATIRFNGTTAPSFNFGGAATAPVFTTAAASNIYFNRGFTNNGSALVFNATSNTYLAGNGTITPNAAITFGHMQVSAGATDTLASGAGAVIVKNFTLNAASSLKLNQNLQVDGNWTNNGGSLSGGSNTVILNAAAGTIGGTASTAFPNLQVGVAATAVSVTMNNNNSCTDLTYHSSTVARTLTLGVADTLAVSGNVTINQPGAAVVNQLAVNSGVCTVAGNLIFSGTNATATWIGRVAVTTGSFTVTGTVTWMSNTAVATEVISVTTGNLTFGSSVTMGSGSGTITATGAATIRFNGTIAPSLNFGGAATVPVFTTAALSNIYFNKGFTNNTNALTFNATSTSYFSSNGTITPNAAITFGFVQIAASAIDTLAAGAGIVTVANDFTLQSGASFRANKDFIVAGNWTNNGGTFDGGTSTVIFNGLTKIIGGTSPTTFYNVQVGNTAVTLNYTANTNVTCNNLVYAASNTARTLTLANGVVLTINGNLTINQPTANNIANALNVNAATCTLAGNLIFTGTSATTSRVGRVLTTSGTFNLGGTITWMGNTVSATEVITTATGTLNFGSSITMGSASGTISVTGAGYINFNGTSAPSLSFGGATAPVLTTTIGSFINFNRGLTAATTALTFATGSNQIFNGTATITPTSAITFGNLQINSGYTITAAGNMAVTGSWANSGTFVPATYTVTFSGASVKTISHTGGETFYNLSCPTAGSTVQPLNDILVTNALTMSGGNIDLNGYTLTLGNNAGASLTYSAGRAYNGTFKRWFPASAITSTSGSYYGLFPIGTSTQYRPIAINTTVSPTTAGYVLASHTNTAGATAVTYTDNQGVAIQQIANMHSDLTTSGLGGGTYSLDVRYTDLGTTGALANLRLITYTGSTLGSYGTHSAATGTVAAPLGRRTGLTVSNLNNAWVISTTNKAATPLFNYVYTRKASGNWNDASATGTWSLTPGGAGAACSCVPTSSGYATIEAGQTVTVTASDSVKFLDIASTGALVINSPNTFNVVNNMTMLGSSTFTNNGTLKVNNELLLSSAVSPTVNGNVQVVGQFTLPGGTAYTQSAGTLTVNGELSLSGALDMASGASFVFDGVGAHLSGTGTYTTAAGGSFPVTNNKVIETGTAITIGTSGTNTTFSIASNGTVSNQGSITINGNLTGGNAASTWENYANSSLSVSGTLLSTGTLDASPSPNTVAYAGSGAQTFKVPVSSYNILTATNAGTKTLAGNIIVDNALTIGGSVIVDESTNSISGAGALNMSGTSELILSRSTASTYPELSGAYTCTGGTVTLNQTADSCEVQTGNYYNLKLNGSTAYDLSGVTSIANNLDIQNSAYLSNNNVLTVGGTFTYASSATTTMHDSIAVNGIVISSGTIQDGDHSINVFGTNGWSKASGATFTASAGTVYFSGTGAQTLGGTSASQTFNNLCVNKSANTLTVGGSTTALTLNGNLILNGGSFDKGTAVALNMNGGDWINNGGSFTPGTGTVTFTGSTDDQAIRGTAAAETFNNLTINDAGFKIAADENITTLNISGDLTLTAGALDAANLANINMTGGNWTSNGATFMPGTSLVTFNSATAQAINGTDTTQYFHSITVNKGANTLSVGGSTTALVLSGNHTITAGTFNTGTAANMYVGGDWTMTGGSFTNTGSTVTMNGSAVQNMRSTGAFDNLKMDNASGYANLTGDITINGLLTFASGIIHTNAYHVILGSSATTTGAGATSYIYGNEKINIPNTLAPSYTFEIGDASKYAPVQIAFAGTTSGSGSITAFTTAGDDADINNSGVRAGKNVNRSWTLSNSGVAGFTSYSPVYNFDAADVDAGATPANFIARKYISSWDTTTLGTKTATSTQLVNETTFGKIVVGELDTLTVTTQPVDTFACTGTSIVLTSASTSTPTPAVKWQRDANTGVFADITGGMDGSIYTNFNTTNLSISLVDALNNYKYRAVFSNLNGSATSDSATLTVRTTPTVSSTTPGSVCDSGTVILSATASAGSLNWYAASSGGSSLYTGSSFTTPSVSSNTTYYVDATFNGCTTLSRTSVAATVKPSPTITSTTPGAVCDSGTVNLDVTASAGTIHWYAASTGGVSIKAGGSFTTPSISTTTDYYVDATNNGCTTPTRTAVTATVSITPTATVTYQSCAGVDGNTTIQIGQTNGTAPFTYKLNSGSFNSYDTAHIGNGSTHNLYVQDVYGCTSSATSYTATAVVPTVIATAGSSTTCNCPSAAEGREVYLTNISGELICIINDRGHDLGTITATTYMRPNPVLINNRQGGQDAAMARSFLLDFTGVNLVPSVQVKFPFTNQELSDLITAADATPIASDDIVTLADLGSTQYEGPTEDDTYNTSDATMLVHHRQLGTGSILNGMYVTISLSSNGEHWLHGNSNGSPLPVKLVSFNATANQTEGMVETNWTTAIEINNDYFEIERSADAINFTPVSRVKGAGNSTALLNYSFNDVKPLNGLSYYRLKQVDFDGAFTYSDIVGVTLGKQSSVVLYPNPTQNEFTVDIANASENIKVSILDLNGREVFARAYNQSEPSANKQISIQAKETLSAGLYMVHVETNGTIFKQKLIIN
jgi:hypothetical protein